MAPPFASSSSSSSSSWRNPSAALQLKYNLTALPDDFEPTEAEQDVLKMYEKIRVYEKEAARLKEEAARAKLDAAAAKYEETHNVSSTKKKKKKKRQKQTVDDPTAEGGGKGGEESGSDEEDEDEEGESSQQPLSLAEVRAAKLAELREEVEETKKNEQREEELRAQLLGKRDNLDANMATDFGLKKKQRREPDENNKASLIANITAQSTPPHEFSDKIGLKSWQGTVLFPTSKDIISWSPPLSAMNPNDEALSFELEGFDSTKRKSYNTIAIKYTAPIDSKRFSFNIAGPNHNEYDSVNFHFNPRQEKGGLLVLNSKQEGMWGQAVNVPISRLPSKIFGEVASTVMIQIHDEGFDVYIEDKHCARLEHRDEIKPGSKLYLQFAATDDRGNPENWSVYKVWWGHKEVLAQEDLSDVHGVNAFIGMHPKKLFIKGLDVVASEAEVELRRAQLERAFRKYGGDRGVVVTAPKNARFAFVECDSEQLASMALSEMVDEYDIKRARRKKHEALQEERAAAEATKESSEWN